MKKSSAVRNCMAWKEYETISMFVYEIVLEHSQLTVNLEALAVFS